MTTILKTRRGGKVFGDYGHGTIEADPGRNGSCLITFTVSEQCEGTGRVDRKAGIIRGVKILGKTSLNGREYSDSALESAVPLYEGVRVNLDHPTKQAIKQPRSVKDWIGELRNVRRSGDGVYGDLHLIASHPYAPGIMESAEKFPNKFGLSHNADCGGFNSSRGQVIESVDNVRSVDLVQNPATNNSLFEGYEGKPMSKSRQAIDEVTDMVKFKMAAITEIDHMVNSMLPNGAEDQALDKEIMAILMNGTMSIANKLAKIRAIFKRVSPNSASDATSSSATTEGYEGTRKMKTFRQLLSGSKPGSPRRQLLRVLEMDGMADMPCPDGVCNDSMSSELMAIVKNPDLSIDEKLSKIRALIAGTSKDTSSDSTPADATIEGYDGERTRLNYGGSAGLAKLIKGRTPAGPPQRSRSVLESDGQSSLPYSGGSAGLAKLIGAGKTRIY